MTNFKSKNLCDKNSKNKNLRWQFCWIFRWLRRGILSFFCRWFFHGEICKISLLIFRIFMKIEKNKFLSAKICTLKFVFVIIFIMRTVRNLLSDRCKKRFRKQTFLGLTPVTWANTIWGKSPAFYLEVYVLVLFNHMRSLFFVKLRLSFKRFVIPNFYRGQRSQLVADKDLP